MTIEAKTIERKSFATSKCDKDLKVIERETHKERLEHHFDVIMIPIYNNMVLACAFFFRISDASHKC